MGTKPLLGDAGRNRHFRPVSSYWRAFGFQRIEDRLLDDVRRVIPGGLVRARRLSHGRRRGRLRLMTPEQRRAYHERRVLTGICIACGSRKVVAPKRTCVRCSEKHRLKEFERRRNRRAAGLCIRCRQPSSNRIVCKSCTTQNSQSRRLHEARRRDAGSCQFCDRPIWSRCAKSRRQVCEEHFFREVSTSRLGSVRHWQTIQAKFYQQEGRCAWSGEELSDMALDHVLPTKRFPELANDPTNVEWVTRHVNWMKASRTPDEFVAYLQHIIDSRVSPQTD